MAEYSVVQDVAVIGLSSPPVNILWDSVQRAIQSGVEKANQDKNVAAIVIYGKGGCFSVGGDINDLEALRAEGKVARWFPEKALEQSGKPIVAAVHGACVGGGLLLALLAHYRIAHEKSVLGLPEVKLGLVSVWGATQRIPRETNLKDALEIITLGENFGAKKAKDIGLIDQITSGNILDEGIKFAQSICGKPFKHLITSKMEVQDKAHAEQLLQDALMKAKKVLPGRLAPVMCIKSVEAAMKAKTFEEGEEISEQFARVAFYSGQALALQYAFMAEKAATKWQLPGGYNNRTVKVRPLKSGCVIGAGTMGTGIAMAMLNVGIPVVLIEQNEKFMNQGVSVLLSLYDGSVKLGRMSPEQAKKCLSLLTPTLDFQKARHADIVIEAVFENVKVKKEIFSKLDKICKPGATLCSNTSSLNIDEIASATSRPQDVIGTHFFAPAYHMPLLENIRGEKTSPGTIATATNFGLKLKKVPVLVGNCRGFVANRMNGNLRAEAGFLLEEGALPEEVDQVLEDFGLPLGPLKLTDLSGLDIGWRIRQGLYGADKLDGTLREIDGERYNSLPDILCQQGRLGRKTGKGWYKYEKPGAKKPFVEEDVTDLIIQYCRKNGMNRRKISNQEILERCLYSAINEGFKILEEGIASKPEDVDTIWLTGFAWPRHTGGPMFYANTVGLDKVLSRIQYYHQQHSNVHHWKPSSLLIQLSQGYVPMKDWTKHAKSKL